MKQNRVIAFIFAIVMVFNMSINAIGEMEQEQSAQKHTVTWYASADNSSLVPLESSRTSMTDNGSTLTAVSDTVDTTIHTVYHENQTLVSVEMAGTGFSFSPVMLNDYYPVLAVDESEGYTGS